MEILIKAGQLLLSLAILVTLHEFGHYITARMFKTRVEKFYLFFNPWFSLFSKKIGETEYGIGWVPLGGYVKIAGMIDESMDKEQMKLPAQPWEFRAKPAWQRLIIMLGGIMVNLLLGWFIYSMLLFSVGEKYIPIANAKYGVMVDSIAYQTGFRNGDKIVSVSGHPVQKLNDVVIDILVNDAREVIVERNGIEQKIIINDSTLKNIISAQGGGFLTERIPFVIDDFDNNESVAKDAGMKHGDQVIGIDSENTFFYDQVKVSLAKNAGKEILVTYLRNGTDTVRAKMKLPSTGLLGVHIHSDPLDFFTPAVTNYNIIQCFPAGFVKAENTLVNYIKQFKLIFSPKVQGYKHLGGFISIGKVFSPTWDWLSFWSLTAFLSIVLAFMNLLPIPALDGGHVMFTLYEIITGRKPNEKFLEYAQITGMVLLLSLMLFANGNDIMRLFK